MALLISSSYRPIGWHKSSAAAQSAAGDASNIPRRSIGESRSYRKTAIRGEYGSGNVRGSVARKEHQEIDDLFGFAQSFEQRGADHRVHDLVLERMILQEVARHLSIQGSGANRVHSR